MAIQLTEPGAPKASSKNMYALGIDFGTTNSVVALWQEGKVQVIRNLQGKTMTPSTVSYVGAQPFVGEDVDTNAVRSIKRLFQADEELLQAFLKRYDGMLRDGEQWPRLTLGGKVRHPIEIAADILRHLKETANKVLQRDIDTAVITVPAYFGETARGAIRLAAQMAGLKVLRLLSEPTAAAVAYGFDALAGERILVVYDLGGGTFDVSVLKVQDGVFQVLATGGIATFGGDDIDARVVADMKAYVNRAEYTVAENRFLLQLAKMVKETLSEKDEASADLSPFPEVDRPYTLTRARFNEMLTPLLEPTFSILNDTLAQAGIDKKAISDILLVGGATRMPLVQATISQHCGKKPQTGIDPDLIVAEGAAMHAHSIISRDDTLLLDVTPLSLGLETMGGIVEKVLPRNTPIPACVTQTFTTYADGQSALSVHVVQGERELAKDCRSLGKFALKNLPPLPAGVPRIDITFSLDADGLLSVSAHEKETGDIQQVEVNPAHGLTEEDIKRILLESQASGLNDMQERVKVDQAVRSKTLS